MIKHHSKTRAPARHKATAAKPPQEHPNRIFELTQERKWTYAEVAERVRHLAPGKKHKDFSRVHEVTISRLANGLQNLTLDWMKMLGEVYAVPATELIAKPLAVNIIRIPVTFYFEGGKWSHDHRWPEKDCYEIMIPQDAALAGVPLYAGELKGPASNLKYPEKSIVICSQVMQRPDEIAINRRYHVRATREDGKTEETIRCLTRDQDGKFWLKPESNHPDHQAWLPLDGTTGIKVELIGHVRGVYTRED